MNVIYSALAFTGKAVLVVTLVVVTASVLFGACVGVLAAH